jgi:Tubulin domain
MCLVDAGDPDETSYSNAKVVSQANQPDESDLSTLWRGRVERLEASSLRIDYNDDNYGGLVDASTSAATDPRIANVATAPDDTRTADASAHNHYNDLYNLARTRARQNDSRYRVAQSKNTDIYDDDNEEEPSDEDEDDYYKERRQRQMQLQQEQEAAAAYNAWDTYWQSTLQGTAQVNGSDTTLSSAAAAAATSTPAQPQPPPLVTNLPWHKILMPPYSQKSLVQLPCRHNSNMVEWDYYKSTDSNGPLSDWMQDDLLERVRHWLEDCDSFQGMVICTDGSAYAGIATGLLQYIHDECNGAQKLIYDMRDTATAAATATGALSDRNHTPLKSKQVILRHHVQEGLAYHDWMDTRASILPLYLPTQYSSNFVQTATLASALESVALPWRLSTQNAWTAVNNGQTWSNASSDEPFETVAQMSMVDYVRTLQPSSQHSLLELDVLAWSSPECKSNAVASMFRQGTSIERDYRMRYGPSRSSASRVDPGAWLQDVSRSGGLLTSVSTPSQHSQQAKATTASVPSMASASKISSSPSNNFLDRSLHTHFALSTFVRMDLPSLQSVNVHQSSFVSHKDALTCLMQGMSISCRPESSLACLVPCSLVRLTQNSLAGSYWSHLMRQCQPGTPLSDMPVLSVLGNSTRSHSLALSMSDNLRTTLSPRLRNFLSRDTGLGILPEWDDCEQALGSCLALRDVYRPPRGSGLYGGDDDDDDYDMDM